MQDDLKIDPEQRKELDNLNDEAKWTYILGNRKKAAEIVCFLPVFYLKISKFQSRLTRREILKEAQPILFRFLRNQH